MDSFFNKNLQFIKDSNRLLYESLRIIPYDSENYSFNTNLAGEYNLCICQKPVHSITGAQSEASEHFEKLSKDTLNTIHVIYGFGLGYLPDYYTENAKGTVVVFESDLKLLRFVFESADFSGILSSGKLYIASDFSQLKMIYESVFKYGTITTYSVLDYYKAFSDRELSCFKENLSKLQNDFEYNYNYQSLTMSAFLKQMLSKINIKSQLPLFSSLKSTFKNKPAVIVSAGPSLYHNIDDLREYRENAVIFSVGTALKTLLKNDVTPDFVNYIERFYSASQFDDIETEKLNIVVEPTSNSNLYNKKFKNMYITTSYENNANHLYNEQLGIKGDYIEAKGTVAYHALYCAKVLGCNPIILLGQDLAYLNGRCYSKGSVYEDLICVKNEKTNSYTVQPLDRAKFKNILYLQKTSLSEEDKDKKLDGFLEKVNLNITSVKGINGELLPTSTDYKKFIGYFEDFARRADQSLKLYNASEGAQIDGFENKSLKSLLKDIKPIENKNNIINKYTEKTANNLKVLTKNLSASKDIIIKTVNQIESSQNIFNEAEYTHLSKFLDEFYDIRSKNTFLRLITLNEYNNLMFAIKEYGAENPEALKKASLRFYDNIVPLCKDFIKRLDYNIGKCNESCNTKS